MASDMQMISDKFGGKWKYDRSENFDEFLQAMGIGMVKRKMAQSASPTCEIRVEGGVIIICTSAGMGSKREDRITVDGQEFETESPGGVKGKVKASFEDGKITAVPTGDAAKQKSPTTRRYIDGDQMVLELEVDNVVCKRFFKKV